MTALLRLAGLAGVLLMVGCVSPPMSRAQVIAASKQCTDAGMGYWNKIRADFPELFAQRCNQSRRLNWRPFKLTENGVTRRIYLDELPLGAGRYEAEPAIECGIGCSASLEEIDRTPTTEAK